jgi:NADPH-dependent 2,4-dienoyl-CoA reductase/sulfur reductase-like enzyme
VRRGITGSAVQRQARSAFAECFRARLTRRVPRTTIEGRTLMKNTTDVLIVGAGPVGLLLAAELSRDGVELLLIDHLPKRAFFVRRLA